MMKKKTPRQTPKQLVMAKWPFAFSYAWRDSYCIYRPHLSPRVSGNVSLGHGKTAAQAWANALQNLEAEAA